jgi:hypothetical protein
MLIESSHHWLILRAEPVCCQSWNVWTQDEIINQPAFQTEQSTISRFGLSAQFLRLGWSAQSSALVWCFVKPGTGRNSIPLDTLWFCYSI